MTAVTTAEAPPAPVQGARAGAALVSIATVVVSALNYGLSLLLVHVLAPADYADFASAQSLLLVLGTACMAGIPWAVARMMATEQEAGSRSAALHFGLSATALQAVFFIVITAAALGSAVSLGTTIAACCAAVGVSVVAVPLGVLQGLRRFTSIAVLRLLEGLLRTGLAVLSVVVLTPAPFGPISAFAVGSLAVFVAGMALCRVRLPLRRGDTVVVRQLLRGSLGSGAIQIALAALTSLDTLVIQYVHMSDDARSSYQVAALLGRSPVFIASAIAVVYFGHVAAAPSTREARHRLGEGLALYVVVGLPLAVGLATAPTRLLDLVLPDGYDGAFRLTLACTCVAGFAFGALGVLVTGEQALARYRTPAATLAALAVGQPVILLVAGHFGPHGYALAVMGYAVLCAVVAATALRRWLAGSWVGRREAVIAGACVLVALAPLAGAVAWAVASALTVALVVRYLQDGRRTP